MHGSSLVSNLGFTFIIKQVEKSLSPGPPTFHAECMAIVAVPREQTHEARAGWSCSVLILSASKLGHTCTRRLQTSQKLIARVGLLGLIAGLPFLAFSFLALSGFWLSDYAGFWLGGLAR